MIFAVLLLISLVSCGTANNISDGEKNEIVGYFRDKLSETSALGDEDVFWTKNGSVYHLFEDCRFLSESDDIRHGPVARCGRSAPCSLCSERAAATTSEIEESAAVLLARETESEQSESVAQSTIGANEIAEPIAETDAATEAEVLTSTEAPADVSNAETVYWTVNGSVWHTDRNCSALAKSKEVLSGTVEESGKERGCKLCNQTE